MSELHFTRAPKFTSYWRQKGRPIKRYLGAGGELFPKVAGREMPIVLGGQ